VTNPARLSGLSHRDNFIMTANLSPLIGTVQKQMLTLTGTATNSNPLTDSFKNFDNLLGHPTNKSKSLAAATATADAAAKHMLFYQCWTIINENFKTID